MFWIGPFLINGESGVEEELPEEGRGDSIVDGEHSLGSEYSDRSPHHPNLHIFCGLHKKQMRENLARSWISEDWKTKQNRTW